MLEEERYQANLKGLLPLIYIIPSYVAHFAVLYVIFNKRNKDVLGTIFFKIYGISAIISILNSIFNYLYNRVRYTPALLFIFDALPERSFFLTFLYTCVFFTIYADLFFSSILHFNRASVILLKAKYHNFWQKALYPMIILICVISLVCICHAWFTDVSIQLIDPKDHDQGYDWSRRKKIPWLKNSTIMIGIVAAVAVGSLASNLYVMFYFITSNSDQIYENRKQNKDAQKRLFVFTAISFCIHVAFMFLQLMFTITTDNATIYFFIAIQAYIQDLMNFSPPWLLLFVCPQVRKCLTGRKNEIESSTTIKIKPTHPSTSVKVTPSIQ